MVPDTRAALGTHALRPLSTPTSLSVRVDAAGQPLAVKRGRWSSPRAVARVQDRWRIDDEWWRERPVSRLYYTVVLEGDLLLTLYHDLLTDAWFEQRG